MYSGDITAKGGGEGVIRIWRVEQEEDGTESSETKVLSGAHFVGALQNASASVCLNETCNAFFSICSILCASHKQ